MRDKTWFYFIVTFSGCIVLCRAATDEEDVGPMNSVGLKGYKENGKCWMSLKSKEVFQILAEIDNEFAAVRAGVQSYLEDINFDHRMLETTLIEGAVAYREIPKLQPQQANIPSGLNLGGLCMMKMPYSVIFFHRMKLRNNTIFRIDSLHSDIENMVLKADLSLNSLHLTGAYDRSMTDKDPSALIYTPSFGELQILMSEVQYTVQGRYRLIDDRLTIELVVSTLDAQDISLTYASVNETDSPVKLEKDHMGDFMMRLKTDLDKWVQDYFNDYLIMTSLEDVPNLASLRQYDQQKATALSEFMDDALIQMNKKLSDIGGDSIRLPNFKILAANGLSIQIYGGTLQGLNTMYRRSVATTYLERENLRYVDTIIGFSDLKVSYEYEVNLPPIPEVRPALNGLFIMSANEITAHLSLGLLREPEMVELDIDFINQLGADSITVEGYGNAYIANFKHILEHEIATIMSSSVTYGVGLLKTLPKCEPFVPGMLKRKPKPEIVKIQSSPIDTSAEFDIDAKVI